LCSECPTLRGSKYLARSGASFLGNGSRPGREQYRREVEAGDNSTRPERKRCDGDCDMTLAAVTGRVGPTCSRGVGKAEKADIGASADRWQRGTLRHASSPPNSRHRPLKEMDQRGGSVAPWPMMKFQLAPCIATITSDGFRGRGAQVRRACNWPLPERGARRLPRAQRALSCVLRRGSGLRWHREADAFRHPWSTGSL